MEKLPPQEPKPEQETPVIPEPVKPEEAPTPVVVEVNDAPKKSSFWKWDRVVMVVALGILFGFLGCYLVLVVPMNNELAIALHLQNSGLVTTNKMKLDFTTMQSRQQEMEIRYLKSSAELEKANLYIVVLQLKEKTTLARLQVMQKNGLDARETLAQINTLYDRIYPDIEKKDKKAADDLNTLITTAVQDLTADPETASSDLEELSSHLNTVETALFKVE